MGAILGVDDTDSRSEGMCTTWIASEIARRLSEDAVAYLVRLHPAIPHKTRGNGAVALETAASPRDVRAVATEVIDEHAVLTDPETNPGLVVVSDRGGLDDALAAFAASAVRQPVERETALALTPARAQSSWRNGRGLIGATAAVGAVYAWRGDDHDRVFSEWTYEELAYREPSRWGTDRDVSVPDTAAEPEGVWDTIDPATGAPVCVPRSPCPVLFGVRGADPAAVERAADAIGGESTGRRRLFRTNQGTDGHLRPGRLDELEDGYGYRLRGRVIDPPSTGEGGHVTFRIADDDGECGCIAFAPTGRFRERVRRLRVGDTVIVCGEAGHGTVKLEKFALVGRALTAQRVPRCPMCARTMESAGREQGYRCRSCGTAAAGKRRTAVDRELARGWYEVPPGARRHLAEPLAGGQYDLPVYATSRP